MISRPTIYNLKPLQIEAMKTQDPDATFETKSGLEVRAWKLETVP